MPLGKRANYKSTSALSAREPTSKSEPDTGELMLALRRFLYIHRQYLLSVLGYKFNYFKHVFPEPWLISEDVSED